MSVELFLHSRKVESVFQLLGTKENDMTYALGWVLSQSPKMCAALIRAVLGSGSKSSVERVLLQEHHNGGGFTDIELLGPHVHVIIEAKRGWVIPTAAQLAQYAPRLPRKKGVQSALVTMSECSTDYAKLHLKKSIGGIRVTHLSWSDVQKQSRIRQGTHAEKRLLAEFRTYLEHVVKMQNQTSNLVYVVSVASGKPEWFKLSWVEIITKRKRYFHPVGNGWPKEPPNYIAFRYDGKLQSIHHIDNWTITKDIRKEMRELNPGVWDPHFLYRLGSPIVPPKTVKTGKIYPSGRVWAMLDLLLTCDTIAQARDETKARQGQEQ